MTTNKEMHEAISLSQWTRSFAEYTGFLIPNPPLSQVETAISTYLPNQFLTLDLANVDTESLLEDGLGITAIVQIGTEKIGWRTVASRTEAEVLQLTYSSFEYSRARQLLGIDVYWLVIVNIEMLDVYTRGDLYEAQMATYDDIEDRPECAIVNL